MLKSLRAGYILWAGLFCLICVSGYGCGSAKGPAQLTPSAPQLLTIGAAYGEATARLDHPPENKEEFLPYLKDIIKNSKEWTSPDDVLRSKNDGEEFVINWAVDIRDLQGLPQKMPVVAYEKLGKDGMHYVLQGRRYVSKVSDENLAELPFPPGSKRPH
jgi:hypothetical protein